MGVLRCDRDGCENIMCDRMSTCRRYYICHECFDELVRLGPATNIDLFFNGQVKETFNLDASRAYFEKLFPLRDSMG